MHKTDADGATVTNEFTDGVPAVTEATVLGSKWLNTVQRELIAVVEAGGVTLDDAQDGQVLEALNVLYKSTPAWTAMTMISPWLASSHTPSYRFELSAKRVFLKGTLDATITGSGDWDFWAVPVGHRPPFGIYIGAVAYNGTIYQNCVLHLGLGGTPFMEIFSINGAAPTNGVSYTVFLDGVSWAID